MGNSYSGTGGEKALERSGWCQSYIISEGARVQSTSSSPTDTATENSLTPAHQVHKHLSRIHTYNCLKKNSFYV